MSDAAERAWQEWRTKTSPEYKRWGIGDVERAFLAGWAAREAELAGAGAADRRFTRSVRLKAGTYRGGQRSGHPPLIPS